MTIFLSVGQSALLAHTKLRAAPPRAEKESNILTIITTRKAARL